MTYARTFTHAWMHIQVQLGMCALSLDTLTDRIFMYHQMSKKKVSIEHMMHVCWQSVPKNCY